MVAFIGRVGGRNRCWPGGNTEILEEIHNQSLEDSLGETSIVENPYEEFVKETIEVSLEEKSHDHCMVENQLDKGDEYFGWSQWKQSI